MTVTRQLIVEGAGWDCGGERRQQVCPVGQFADDGSGAGGSAAHSRLAQLNRTIESEVIPQLLRARRAERGSPAPTPAARRFAPNVPSAADVADFTKVLLACDGAAATSFLDTMHARHVPLDSICLELMTPAARRLGEFWVADLCSFTDVTVALGRLQRLLREMSHDFYDTLACLEHGRRALLVAAPGEQHTFGALMVVEFLRRAGWDVFGEPGVSGREIVASVRREWFGVVGFSVSSERHLDAVASIIRALRRHSRNRAVRVMVGGNVFLEHPEFVALVGADATATDAQQVVHQAEAALTVSSARRAGGDGA